MADVHILAKTRRWQQPPGRSARWSSRRSAGGTMWAWTHGVVLDFSRPGKPTDNAFTEFFNGRVRAECLNAFWFLSLDDARVKCGAWRVDYNEVRPHSSLGNQTPVERTISSAHACLP